VSRRPGGAAALLCALFIAASPPCGAQEPAPSPASDPGAAPASEPAPSPAPEPAPQGSAAPGREVSFPPSEVKDTFFAYVLGVIASGQAVDMDSAAMRAVLVEFKSALDLPFDLITRVTQGPDPATGRQSLVLEFQRDVSIPVPFALLWYHPGSIVISRDVTFDVRRTEWTDPVAGGDPAAAFDLDLARGSALVDIDDWLEALFSSNLEDSWIRHIVFFRWDHDWMGMIEGTGRRTGRTRRAFFDFTKNEIRFPAPEALYQAGRGFVP
jgi:hypothetical protein